MRALIFVAQSFFAHRAIQGNWQPLQAVFQDVVVDALLDAIDRGFFAERARDEQKRNVAPGRTQVREGVETGSARQAIVGEHHIERLILERAVEIITRFHQGRLDAIARIAQLEQDQFDIVGRMFDEEHAQRRGRGHDLYFFQDPRFHGFAPESCAMNAPIGGG
jgi:hypothetical protein